MKNKEDTRVIGDYPNVVLKALGIYPSERMTIGAHSTSFAAIVADISGPIATVAIVPPARFQPRQLHRQPGLPFNAYALINGVAVSIVCTVAAPTTFTFSLLYRDPADIDTLVFAYRLPAGILVDSVASPILPIVSSTNMGELPAKYGDWALSGTVVLGACTGITVSVTANLGMLYGAP